MQQEDTTDGLLASFVDRGSSVNSERLIHSRTQSAHVESGPSSPKPANRHQRRVVMFAAEPEEEEEDDENGDQDNFLESGKSDRKSKLIVQVVQRLKQVPLSPPESPDSKQSPRMQVSHVRTTSVCTWQKTIETSIHAIVSLRILSTKNFDTERTGTYNATGFIVDKARGIMLSNRHVVGPGPVLAKGVFSNYEELELAPIYRDPVHDFGFFLCDLSKIKYMEVGEIELCPDMARIGTEIRVVGNDANEKLSILQGTLARLDRPAPIYGDMMYSDFNTFYLQAASSTSGGSSGSPVLNIRGQCIALNAGANSQTSQGYYFPLNRVLRALRLLQRNRPVPRGTLQIEWRHSSFDEVRRMGFPEETEIALRKMFPESAGVLVAHSVLPGGPAHNLITHGDVLVAVDGQLVDDFICLESILDNHVGDTLQIRLSRGSKKIVVNVRVQDLHSITPDMYLEFGDSIIHSTSYQMARSNFQPTGTVFLASSGYLFGNARVPRCSIITSVNDIATPNIDVFIRTIAEVPSGTHIRLKYHSIQSTLRERSTVLKVDLRYFSLRVARRNPCTGNWDYTCLKPRFSSNELSQITTSSKHMSHLELDSKYSPANTLVRSMVKIESMAPYLIDGVDDTLHNGTGFVVDSNLGLIMTDRRAVPLVLSEITVTFTNNTSVEANVVFMHPFRNIVVLVYDVKKVEQVPELKLSSSGTLAENYTGPALLMVLSVNYQFTVKHTIITAVEESMMPHEQPPRFRSMNTEQLLVDDPVLQCRGGVLLHPESGEVLGMWSSYDYHQRPGSSFFAGMPVSYCVQVLSVLRKAAITRAPQCIHYLDVEFEQISLKDARMMELSEYWTDRLAVKATSRHTALNVHSKFVTTPMVEEESHSFQCGDIVLKVRGVVITRVLDLHEAEVLKSHCDELWPVLVWRRGAAVRINVSPSQLPVLFSSFRNGVKPPYVVGWCGAIFQLPYRSVLEQVVPTHPLIKICDITHVPYISCVAKGSPGEWCNLSTGCFVTSIGDVSLIDCICCDSVSEEPAWVTKILNVIMATKHGQGVRLELMDRNGKKRVTSVQCDENYWPSFIVQDNATNDRRVKYLHG